VALNAIWYLPIWFYNWFWNVLWSVEFRSLTICLLKTSLKGKTLTAIAVILTNFHDGKPLPVERIKKSQLKKECNVNDQSMKLGGNNTSEKADGLIKGERYDHLSQLYSSFKFILLLETSKITDLGR